MESNETSKLAGPLTGLTIVEFATMITGPFAGQILADLGATVIKVEGLTNEIMRNLPPLHKGLTGGFAQWNRNKKSISVDFKSKEGLALVLDLVRKADGFIENNRPGVSDRLGLSYEALTAINPGLIYVAISGFGDTGPYKDLPTYDLTIQGVSGFMFRQGAERGPEVIRCTAVDKATGLSAATAMMAALISRIRNGGPGQKINVSMLDAYAAFIAPDLMYEYTFADTKPAPPHTTIFNVVKVKDGYVTGLFLQRSQLESLADAFGRQDLLTDPRFTTSNLLIINQPALFDALADQLKSITKAEFMQKAITANLPVGPVNTIEEFFEDPQVKNNESYVEFEDPEFGVMRLVNSFARFSRTPANPRARAPKLGEHNAEILSTLGLNETEIESLRQRNVVGR